MAFVDESSSQTEESGWWDYANCLGVDPDLFFPERGASTKEAKEVCRGCIVREDCLESVSYTHLTLPTNREL